MCIEDFLLLAFLSHTLFASTCPILLELVRFEVAAGVGGCGAPPFVVARALPSLVAGTLEVEMNAGSTKMTASLRVLVSNCSGKEASGVGLTVPSWCVSTNVILLSQILRRPE